MKKASYAWFAGLTALLIFASGCSGNNGASPAAGGAGSAGGNSKVIKLTFWGGVPEEAGPTDMVKAWNEANPDVQVEYVRYVNDDSGNLKLDTALVAGESIDLYTNYAKFQLEKRVQSGGALNLSELDGYDIEGVMGEQAKAWQFDGSYYGLPTVSSQSFIWLNKNKLDAAGLGLPETNWTQSDLAEYAKVLSKDSTYGYVQSTNMFVFNMDGQLQNEFVKDGKSNLDNPVTRSSLEAWYKMMHEDKSMPAYGEQIATKLPVDASFLKGEAAMLGSGNFIFRNANNLTDYPRDFKIAFATIPRPDGARDDFRVEGGLSDVIAINPKSAYKEEAWKFLKWYADEGVVYMTKGGRIPASKKIDATETQAKLIAGFEDLYDLDSMKKVLFGDQETYINTVPVQLNDLRMEEIEHYFLKGRTLDETVQNIAKRHNELIAREK
ncbi:bicyclomycin resistance protein [Paenibacillus albidus]|uniref:Bicyclomycin resistance protein n=1 Tax=Paenibacillus albidus TaxID=2041023 RepID=A0A917FL84_9BACL|nr:extracellular solute-binding protein [Paenibacillus albidus]GGF90537.1 bicyclomycin resistance protein [Paenibacillus albidus]